jgi:hypothetical protein
MNMKKYLTNVAKLVAMLVTSITLTACPEDVIIDPIPDDSYGEKDISITARQILADIEGKYIGTLEDLIIWKDGKIISNGYNSKAYRCEITVKKQSDGLYQYSMDCDGHNVHVKFIDAEIREFDGKVELRGTEVLNSYMKYSSGFKVDTNYNSQFGLVLDGEVSYTFKGKKSLPEDDVISGVSANVSYADYAYNISISSSLSSKYPGRTIKYGVECGYDSYGWQLWASGSGTDYSVVCCVFVDGLGSPYANEAFNWKTYMNLKDQTKLEADQQGLLSDLISILNKSEDKAQSQFIGRVFAEIDEIRYYFKNF